MEQEQAKRSKNDAFQSYKTQHSQAFQDIGKGFKTQAKSRDCVLQISAHLCNSIKTRSEKQRHGRVLLRIPNPC